MKRLACAVVALATLAGPLAAPVLAQTKMDCSRLYKDFWEKMDREKYAKISAEQLAGVSRLALRAYDACQAGDELDAKALFDAEQDDVLSVPTAHPAIQTAAWAPRCPGSPTRLQRSRLLLLNPFPAD